MNGFYCTKTIHFLFYLTMKMAIFFKDLSNCLDNHFIYLSIVGVCSSNVFLWVFFNTSMWRSSYQWVMGSHCWSLRRWVSVFYLYLTVVFNDFTYSSLILNKIRVRIGEWDFSSTSEPHAHIERKIVEKIVHPKYNFFTYEYDLALLKLDKRVDFQDNIIPICLPGNNDLLIGNVVTYFTFCNVR